MHGSGRIITHNRRYIKPCPSLPFDGSLLTSPVSLNHPAISNKENNISQENSIPPTIDGMSNNNTQQSQHQQFGNDSQEHQENSRIPAMLKRILPYNQPGLKE